MHGAMTMEGLDTDCKTVTVMPAHPENGREIRGAGTHEQRWQEWGMLNNLPRLPLEDLLAPDGRVWVIAPHPDDEVLACGGFLRALSRMGREVRVVAVTDGAASHPQSGMWTPLSLARERARESRRALDRLGLPHVPLLRLGMDDGRITRQANRLLAYLDARLRPADLVLATWVMDGHPDHEAVGAVARDAAMKKGARLLQMPVWMWHWASPADIRVPWNKARRFSLSAGDLQAKSAAVACYNSQLEPDPSTGNPAIVSATALQRLLRREEVFFL